MNNLINTVENFCKFAGNMKVNASKCATLAYIWNNGQRTTIEHNLKINGEEIPTYSTFAAISY